jgi:hypothetical protein
VIALLPLWNLKNTPASSEAASAEADAAATDGRPPNATP